MIQIGIPSKGRLKEPVTALFKQAGYKFRTDGRTLRIPCPGTDSSVVLLRTEDIAPLVAAGILDVGVGTQDIVTETGADVLEILPLDLGHCRIVLAVPENGKVKSVKDLDGRTIATSFPNITRDFCSRFGANPRIVKVSGSTEAMVPLGLADAIVDITETGNSLRDNGLSILEEIGKYQTVLVTRPEKKDDPEVQQLVRRLHGAVIAQTWRLIEYNLPRQRLEEAARITPGFKSPTVTNLEDPDWCAVRAMVPTKKVNEIMDALEAIGGTAILQYSLENCRL